TGVVASFLLLIAVGFGTGWIFIVLGLLIRTPMTVMTIGFTFIFPLVFASNIMVRPATMPDWLRAFVENNPVSRVTTALGGLMAGTATAAEVGLALVAPLLLTLLLSPVVLWLYRRSWGPEARPLRSRLPQPRERGCRRGVQRAVSPRGNCGGA